MSPALESKSPSTGSRLPSTLWLLAFLCSLFFVNDWQLELFGAAFLILLTWVVVTIAQDLKAGVQIPQSPVMDLAAAFWLLVLLSVLWSEVPFVSMLGFCLFSAMPLTFFVFVIQGQEKPYEILAKLLAVVFAALAIWAMVQYYVLGAYYEGQARHPLANPGSLAALFNLALFPALGWMLLAPNKLQSNLALGLSLLLIGGIIATGNRGAVAALLPALVIFMIVGSSFAKAHWKCLSLVLLGTAALVVLSQFGAVDHHALAFRMGETLTGQDHDLLSNRDNIWASVIGVIKDHVWLGTGIGTLFLYYPQYRVPEDLIGAFMAHSDPLQYWAELGVLGPVLFYSFLIAAALRTFIVLRGLPKDDPRRILIIAPFCALFAVIAHSHVTFNLYNFSILFGCSFLLSYWFLQTGKGRETKMLTIAFPEIVPIPVRTVLLALPFVFLAYVFGSLILSEHFLTKGKNLAFARDIDGFAENINIAHKVGLKSNYRAYVLAVSIPLGVLKTQGPQMPPAQQKNMVDQVFNYLDAAEALNPRSAAIPFYRARVQQLVSADLIPEDVPSPETLYAKALKLDPLHAGARLGLVQILQERGDLNKAINVAQAGMHWQYNTANARDFFLQAGMLYLQAGQPEKHKEAMAALTRLHNRMEKQNKKSSVSLQEKLFGGGDTL